MKIKKLLHKFTRILSKPAVKSAIITGVIVAGVAIGSTALVLGLNGNNNSLAEHTNQTQAPSDATNVVVGNNSQQTIEEPSPSTTQQPNGGSSSNQKNTTSTSQNQSNNTPPPQPTPDPTSLTTCVYQGAPHNGEYCPYSPPPAWYASTTVYTCSKSSGLVPCPDYKKIASISGGVSLSTHNGVTSIYYATCTFLTADNIQRSVNVDISYVQTYDNWGVVGYRIDCLTATSV